MLPYNRHIEDSLNAIRVAMASMDKTKLDALIKEVDDLGIKGFDVHEYFNRVNKEFTIDYSGLYCTEVTIEVESRSSKKLNIRMLGLLEQQVIYVSEGIDFFDSSPNKLEVIQEENQTPSFSESFFY